jgi:hypothetical protein
VPKTAILFGSSIVDAASQAVTTSSRAAGKCAWWHPVIDRQHFEATELAIRIALGNPVRPD